MDTQSTGRCESCGREGCKVRQEWTQATRTEPAILLGEYAWCTACQVSSPVQYVQEAIA